MVQETPQSAESAGNRLPIRPLLSSFLPGELPEFVREDHPTYVAFLEAYYEWMELPGQALNVSFGLRDIADIDDTLNEFIRQFKETYMLNFPVQLATDTETGAPLDERRIIKNIKAYYKSKGSEKAYQFLFRILYDTHVEFYYPKVDILRASDGKWVIERFMRVTSVNGADTFAAVGHKIRQRDSNTGDITASAQVDRAIQFQSGLYEVTEFVISELFGTFKPPQRIEFELEQPDGSFVTIEENIFTMVITIDVDAAGTGYVEGEVVRLINASGDVGIGALGVIDRVEGGTGAVLRVAVRDPGTNYRIPPTADFSESVAGVGASATVNLGPVFTADGFYANNDGKLSSNKVLQDNYYYQDYSYVLKTEVTIDKWLDIIKKVIHPAGLKVFGEITIFRCVENESPHETIFQAFEMPLIGHYTPYTWLTVNDLAALYPNGFDPGALQGSNPLTPTVAEDGSDGPHVPRTNTAAPGDFTNYADLLARPTLALGSGSGPFWFTYSSPTGTFKLGKNLRGLTTNANALVYALDTTGTKIGVLMTDGEFAIGETIKQTTGPLATATLVSAVTPPDARWGFPYLPKADPIYIIYHHPNRRGMIEIPGPGETNPNPNMRVMDRTMLSGAFTVGETILGDQLTITDLSKYVLGQDFIVGETATGIGPAIGPGPPSGATGIVISWTPASVNQIGSLLVLGGIVGTFNDGEEIQGNTSLAEITIGNVIPTGKQAIIDADPDIPATGQSQIIMINSGDYSVGTIVVGQLSGASATVVGISDLIYPNGMPWSDIEIRDFVLNMPVGEKTLCVPRDVCEVISDAGYPNEDIGGLDGTGPTD